MYLSPPHAPSSIHCIGPFDSLVRLTVLVAAPNALFSDTYPYINKMHFSRTVSARTKVSLSPSPRSNAPPPSIRPPPGKEKRARANLVLCISFLILLFFQTLLADGVAVIIIIFAGASAAVLLFFSSCALLSHGCYIFSPLIFFSSTGFVTFSFILLASSARGSAFRESSLNSFWQRHFYYVLHYISGSHFSVSLADRAFFLGLVLSKHARQHDKRILFKLG